MGCVNFSPKGEGAFSPFKLRKQGVSKVFPGGGEAGMEGGPAGDLLAKKGADLKIVHDPLKGPVVKGPGPRR